MTYIKLVFQHLPTRPCKTMKNRCQENYWPGPDRDSNLVTSDYEPLHSKRLIKLLLNLVAQPRSKHHSLSLQCARTRSSSVLKYESCNELSQGACIQLSGRLITPLVAPPARSSIVLLIEQTAPKHVFAKLRSAGPPPRQLGFRIAWDGASHSTQCLFLQAATDSHAISFS
jgi:hypothetical protein